MMRRLVIAAVVMASTTAGLLTAAGRAPMGTSRVGDLGDAPASWRSLDERRGSFRGKGSGRWRAGSSSPSVPGAR